MLLAREVIQSKISSVRLKAYPSASIVQKGFLRVRTHLGIQVHFRDLFRLHENQSKMCFKLTIYRLAKLKPIFEHKFERLFRCTSAACFLKHFTLQIPLISCQVTNPGKSPPHLFNQNLEYVHLSPYPQPSFVNSTPPHV